MNCLTAVRRAAAHFLACLSTLAAFGCATFPDADKYLYEPYPGAETPVLIGPHGRLSHERSRAVVNRLKRQTAQTDLLERQIALEEQVAGSPLATGNKVTLLRDGPATYRAMFGAIGAARQTVNLETYIFDDDDIGRQLAELLIRKQKEGVQVNLMYDAVGCIGTPREFFDRLRENGINVVEFNPINPLAFNKGWLVNKRDHRKLLVVDGSVAFTGGINISGVYQKGSSGGSFRWSGSSGSSSAPTRKKPKANDGPWRDTQVQIEGPVVAEFQKLFLANWNKQKGPLLDDNNYFPVLERRGRELVRAIGSSPGSPANVMYLTMMSAIVNSAVSVHLTNAYFAPDTQMMEAIKDAAKRGVDVKLVLPSYSDFGVSFHAGRANYDELLDAGVKIYERRNAMLHSKTAVIDGVWSTVGSTNLDWRSFLHNDELNAVVLGHDFGAQMEAMFQDDLAASTEITREAWNRRPLSNRFKEGFSRLWLYWL